MICNILRNQSIPPLKDFKDSVPEATIAQLRRGLQSHLIGGMGWFLNMFLANCSGMWRGTILPKIWLVISLSLYNLYLFPDLTAFRIRTKGFRPSGMLVRSCQNPTITTSSKLTMAAPCCDIVCGLCTCQRKSFGVAQDFLDQ